MLDPRFSFSRKLIIERAVCYYPPLPIPHYQAVVTAGPFISGANDWCCSGPVMTVNEQQLVVLLNHWSVPQHVPPPSEKLSVMTHSGPGQPLVDATLGPSPRQPAVSERLLLGPFSQWSEWNGTVQVKSEVSGGSSPSPWGHTAYPASGQQASWGSREQTGAVSRAPEPSPRSSTGPAQALRQW